MSSNPDVWHDKGTGLDLHFNEDGKFVDDNNEPFPKGFCNDDNFADWLHDYLERRMEAEGLIRIEIPEGGAPIWHSPDAFNKPDKLLVIIQGSGRVRPGLFSVGVCAYAGLGMGSVFPFTEYAKKNNMEVVVLNPNDPKSNMLKGKYPKEDLGCIMHSLEVFKEHIIPGGAKDVYIIAHSMGGESVCSIANRYQQWLIPHVKAIALTDACEDRIVSRHGDMRKWAQLHMIDWICSGEEVNKDLGWGYCCPTRSAGTKDHPKSTGVALPYILEWFDEKMKE